MINEIDFLEANKEYRYTLRNPHNGTQVAVAKLQVSPGDNMIMVGANGYGEHTAVDGHGFPIVIEGDENGHVRVLVWGDINQEEPTHVISLEGAREDNRKENPI